MNRKLFFAAIAIAMIIALAPLALADSFSFAFTTPNQGPAGGSDIFASGTLTGTEIGSTTQWDITGGSIFMTGATVPLRGTGSLIANPNAPGSNTITSGSGSWYITYDDLLTPGGVGMTPYVDNSGLLFVIGGVDVNIFSGTNSNSNFTGVGGNDYSTFVDSNGYVQNGELNVFGAATPEPSSLLLLGTGLLGMGLLLRRKAMKASPRPHLIASF